MKTGVAKEISQSFNVFHTEAYKRVRLFFRQLLSDTHFWVKF